MQKDVPLVKENVMKLEVFILGEQRIDRDGGEGIQRIEKGSRGREKRGLRKGAEGGKREKRELS